MTVRVTFTLLDGPLHLHSVVCSGAGLHFAGLHRKTIFIKTNLNLSVDILDLTCPNPCYSVYLILFSSKTLFKARRYRSAVYSVVMCLYLLVMNTDALKRFKLKEIRIAFTAQTPKGNSIYLCCQNQKL